MKKLLLVVLAVSLLAFGFVSCGDDTFVEGNEVPYYFQGQWDPAAAGVMPALAANAPNALAVLTPPVLTGTYDRFVITPNQLTMFDSARSTTYKTEFKFLTTLKEAYTVRANGIQKFIVDRIVSLADDWEFAWVAKGTGTTLVTAGAGTVMIALPISVSGAIVPASVNSMASVIAIASIIEGGVVAGNEKALADYALLAKVFEAAKAEYMPQLVYHKDSLDYFDLKNIPAAGADLTDETNRALLNTAALLADFNDRATTGNTGRGAYSAGRIKILDWETTENIAELDVFFLDSDITNNALGTLYVTNVVRKLKEEKWKNWMVIPDIGIYTGR